MVATTPSSWNPTSFTLSSFVSVVGPPFANSPSPFVVPQRLRLYALVNLHWEPVCSNRPINTQPRWRITILILSIFCALFSFQRTYHPSSCVLVIEVFEGGPHLYSAVYRRRNELRRPQHYLGSVCIRYMFAIWGRTNRKAGLSSRCALTCSTGIIPHIKHIPSNYILREETSNVDKYGDRCAKTCCRALELNQVPVVMSHRRYRPPACPGTEGISTSSYNLILYHLPKLIIPPQPILQVMPTRTGFLACTDPTTHMALVLFREDSAAIYALFGFRVFSGHLEFSD